MRTETTAQMVTIYINSTDQCAGRPLYSAIVQLCQDHGVAGASVIRCMEGYGSHHELHTRRLLAMSENMPLRIEIIDVPERIQTVLPAIEAIMGEGLVAIRDVQVLRFTADGKE